jgi:hypothetical protein
MTQPTNPIFADLTPDRAAIAQCLLIAYRRGLRLRSQQEQHTTGVRVLTQPSTTADWESSNTSLADPLAVVPNTPDKMMASSLQSVT